MNVLTLVSYLNSLDKPSLFLTDQAYEFSILSALETLEVLANIPGMRRFVAHYT